MAFIHCSLFILFNINILLLLYSEKQTQNLINKMKKKTLDISNLNLIFNENCN